MGRAFAEETRLLEAAEAELRRAAEAEGEAREKARLTFLAGDCARRRGDRERAREALQRAVELDRAGRPGRWAELLLGQQ